MVKRKCVKPLRHFCLKSLPLLVAGHVREELIIYLSFGQMLLEAGLSKMILIVCFKELEGPGAVVVSH